ncbi:MAG: toprim domain-containing protein [Roseovarius sp.]|nr:toprim domain-containing protein [Roseovarius sp.]
MTQAKQQERYDPGQLANGLAGHAEAFCRHYFPNGRKVGNYWQMADVTGAKGRSLMIRLRAFGGKRSGKWVDNQSGEYGDLLDLLQHRLEPIPYPDLLQEAADYLGERPQVALRVPGEHQPAVASNRQLKAGRRLFSYGRSIERSLAEAYLRGRGIRRFGPALAFHPNVYLQGETGKRLEIPALLSAITDNAGQVTGCSRIFLDPSTNRLADIEAPKRVLGRLHGNAIRFGPWQTATDLFAGEGLENTLSVGTAFPRAALASCLTANHLAAFIIPPTIRRLWIVRDNDDTGERGAMRLADRARGLAVQPFVLTPEREDFNADLQAGGVSALRGRLSGLIAAQAIEHDLWPVHEGAGKELDGWGWTCRS